MWEDLDNLADEIDLGYLGRQNISDVWCVMSDVIKLDQMYQVPNFKSKFIILHYIYFIT